jgi:hypothetical protein
MERKYKFRGRRIDRGTWEFGDLIHSKGILATHTPPYLRDRVSIGDREVIPETVVQFTGLYDCNAKEIYEGDIVKTGWAYEYNVEGFSSSYKGSMYAFSEVEFLAKEEDCMAACFVLRFVCFAEKPPRGCLRVRPRYFLRRIEQDNEIVGNIHDNPELLTDK